MKDVTELGNSQNSQKQKNLKNTDSKTFDVNRSETVHIETVSARRDRVTVRIDPKLKETVMGWCEQNGLSFCHVVEGLLTGYIYGVGEKINLDVKRPTINLTVVREVKRVRRYAVEDPVGQPVKSFRELGSPDHCAECGAGAFARVNVGDSLVWLCRGHFEKKKPFAVGYRIL